jgi:hypothetical protein
VLWNNSKAWPKHRVSCGRWKKSFSSLSQYPDPEESQLAVEHLESARRSYLGGQLEEFGFEMELADSALDLISDTGLRTAVRQAIEPLLRHIGAAGL